MSSLLKTALKLTLTGLAFWLVFRRVDARPVGAQLAHANWGWLGLATGLFVTSKILSANRLRRFFVIVGVDLSAQTNRQLYWLGMFYNLFLPGGIGGDGYKVWLLQKQTGTAVRPLVTATLLDRIVGLLPLLSLALLLLPLLPTAVLHRIESFVRTGFGGDPYRPFFGQPSAVILTVLAGLGVLLIQGGAWGVIRRFFPVFGPVFWSATVLSVGVQVAQGLCVWALVRAIDAQGDPAIPAWVAWQLVFLASSVVAALPLTLGGAGARELTFLTGAGWLGLPVSAAVGVSLLFYGITAVISLTGAYFLLYTIALRRSPSA